MALDIELVEGPSQDGLDIVSLVEMKRHLRISASVTAHDDDLNDIIREAGDRLHGRDGELNRSVFPCIWRRYFNRFPTSSCLSWRSLRLPYPPLIEIISIDYVDADESSPSLAIDPLDYVVRTVEMIPEIYLINSVTAWPQTLVHPRSVSVTYRAGYTTYPYQLKRMVKILAAHYFENREATINEPRQMVINRQVDFGMADFRSTLRIPVAYDDWE